jgi:hypothetical protein
MIEEPISKPVILKLTLAVFQANACGLKARQNCLFYGCDFKTIYREGKRPIVPPPFAQNSAWF